MATDYTLYGAELSLYSGKARAYLRFKDLNWKEEISAEIYTDIIVPRVGAPIMPVLHTADDTLVQDTTDIIDFLEARHPEVSVYPSTPKQKLVAMMIEHYAEEWLVMPAMHYRWSYIDEQYDFIMSEFGNIIAPDSSMEEKIAIGEKTSSQFRGSIPFLGVNETTTGAIEADYLTLLERLNAHFSLHDYLLGSRPSIGDFGLMGPLYAHLARDPYPKAIMQEKAPAVYAWVERMNNPKPLSGEFLANDEIPETLLPVLKTLCEEFLPDVLDVITQNSQWFEKNPGGKLPRYLGLHPFTISGVSSDRFVHSYSQWMFQRPLFHYQQLAADDKQVCDGLLKDIGGYETFQVEIAHPVKRKVGQLELVEQN
jgi:glutathione S-transferase